MSLFHVMGGKIQNLLFKKVMIDKLFLTLYKRDLKIYLQTYKDKPLPDSNKSLLLYIYWAFFYRPKNKPSLSMVSLVKLIAKRKTSAPGMRSFRHLKSLRLFAFRLAFISGYLYVDKIILKINPTKNDLFVIWGAHNSGMYMLIERLKVANIKFFICEYGEIPGTLSINREGIFGDSFIAKNWDSIVNFKADEPVPELTKTYIEHMRFSYVSSKGGSADELLYLYLAIFKQQKKIIYVNGVELIASGHLFDKKYIGSETLNANRKLLRSVMTHFGDDERYVVVYKDHPLMQKNYKGLTLNRLEFPSVVFLNGVNIDNLISLSDITITLPSKVVMTSLLYRKPVYVLGSFTIPESVPKLGYYTGNNVGEIKNVLSSINIDERLYDHLVNVLLSDFLIRENNYSLFGEYDFDVEKKNLERIISEQIT